MTSENATENNFLSQLPIHVIIHMYESILHVDYLQMKSFEFIFSLSRGSSGISASIITLSSDEEFIKNYHDDVIEER